MITKLITLIDAPLSSRYRAIETTFSELPPSSSLALLACETERRLRKHTGNDCNIRVFNTLSSEASFLEEASQCDVVGFTSWFSNHQHAMNIAREIKRRSPETVIVVGGPNATNLSRRILANRTYVDYVVSGDGEDTLWRIVAGMDACQIPNLWYRTTDGACRYTFSSSVDLNEVQPFDFRYIANLDLTTYDIRHPEYIWSPSRTPVAISLMRGCPMAARGKRCAYCSIPGATTRFLEPSRAWAQIGHLKDQYGIDWFFEGGDDFTAGDYVERLSSSVDRVQNVGFRCYCNLNRLTERKVAAMRELGVREVFVGIESVDVGINDWSGHKIRSNQALRALETLRNHDVSVSVSFLFGLPGESSSSLGQTCALAREVVERYSNVRMVLISLAMPLIGSRWFSELCSNSIVRAVYGPDLEITDDPDYARLFQASVGQYCPASIAEILSAVSQLRSELRDRIAVGNFGAIDVQLSAPQSDRQSVGYTDS